MWLFMAGGVPMIFVAVFGLVAIGASAVFAFNPAPGKHAYILALCRAVLFASLAGVAGDFVAVTTAVGGNPEWATSENLPLVLVVGFGESMSPAILGFSMIAVAHLISAVGLRRMPAGP